MELETEAQQAACAWLAQLKADTEKEPFAQLFSRLQKQTTVSVLSNVHIYSFIFYIIKMPLTPVQVCKAVQSEVVEKQ